MMQAIPYFILTRRGLCQT